MMKDKLKELADAESAFNIANDAQNDAWEVCEDARKAYEDLYNFDESLNVKLYAAQVAYLATGRAFLAARKVQNAARAACNITTND